MLKHLTAAATLAFCALCTAQPLSTAFTFQGELDNAGAPANGTYDFRFILYDAATGGTQLGSPLCSNNISVANGRITVQLDFGAQFAGQQRFLEVWVRPDTGLTCSSNTGYTTLAPRQNLTASPNAVFALNAAAATTAASSTNTSQLNGQAASFYLNAANLSSGSIPSARLSGSYTNTLNLTNTLNTFAGSGAGLTNLNASSITTGTINPSLLAIPMSVSGSDTTGIIRSTNSATSGSAAGFYGVANATSGSSSGVYGESDSTTGNGVYGLAMASSGFNYGVYGQTNSIGGVGGYFTGPGDGMWAITSGTGKSCVVGIHGGTGDGFGLYGQANGSTGVGVFGRVYSTTGATTGGRFYSYSSTGTGSASYAPATSGITTGAYAECDSGDGTGMFAYNRATTGSGVGLSARADSTNGYAIVATSSLGGTAVSASGGQYGGKFYAGAAGGRALFAQATATSGVTYGVFGQASVNGWAVYAQGDFAASGNKSFRIDHPADPENKYLLHYCAEGPDPLNVYTGKATLNQQGEATIDLPPYFASINKDPRYTLTPIGAAMPLLHIAREVDEVLLTQAATAAPGDPIPAVSFTIAGGAPNAKVSWEVKALRNDRWVQKNGAPVEVEKSGPEKGTYQHPDLYNQPLEKGLNYQATPPTTPIAAKPTDQP